MKKNRWEIDVLIIIAFSLILNYLVVSFSSSEFGVLMGQVVNILGVFVWLMFGVYRITGFQKSNRDLLIKVFNNRCSLKCFSLAFLIFVLGKLTYSFLVEIEFIKNLDLLSNVLFKPIVLSAESFSGNKLTIIILGVILVIVGVFAEELFFRGYLFNIQYEEYGWHAWIINGISWSLIHVFARANVIALLPTAFLISWIYQRTRNFWIVFIAHLMTNVVSIYNVIANYHL